MKVLSLYAKGADSNRDSLLAEIELTSDFNELTDDGEYNYMIEWTMTFDNVVSITQDTPSGGE